jgi:hypothetical protein
MWVLGTGFDTLHMVRDVLVPIMPRITEPNSLILAAGAVHAALMWRHSLDKPSPRHSSAARRDAAQ